MGASPVLCQGWQLQREVSLWNWARASRLVSVPCSLPPPFIRVPPHIPGSHHIPSFEKQASWKPIVLSELLSDKVVGFGWRDEDVSVALLYQNGQTLFS